MSAKQELTMTTSKIRVLRSHVKRPALAHNNQHNTQLHVRDFISAESTRNEHRQYRTDISNNIVATNEYNIFTLTSSFHFCLTFL